MGYAGQAPQVEQAALLRESKTLQQDFLRFFFYLFDVTASNGFMAEKFFGLTSFAHRKCLLWKSCGLSFEIFTAENAETLLRRSGFAGQAKRGNSDRRMKQSNEF